MNQHSFKTRINPVRKSAAGRPNARRLISNGVKLEWPSSASCLALVCIFWVAIIASGTAMAEEPKLRLASIEPTVFFIKEKSTLMLVSGNW